MPARPELLIYMKFCAGLWKMMPPPPMPSESAIMSASETLAMLPAEPRPELFMEVLSGKIMLPDISFREPSTVSLEPVSGLSVPTVICAPAAVARETL